MNERDYVRLVCLSYISLQACDYVCINQDVGQTNTMDEHPHILINLISAIYLT